MTRIYLPGTLPLLAAWADAGEVEQLGQAHAVTPRLQEWFSQGDKDELEYAALVEAAEYSLRLLAKDEDAPRRRLVVAADVALVITPPDVEDRPLSAVLMPGPVRLDAIASIHVDEEDAEADVTRAVQAIGNADRGDQSALLIVDEAETQDLLWYDVSEIDMLIGRPPVPRKPAQG